MADSEVSYPRFVGLVFIFNLILGTGILTMPAVFVKAGYILGPIVLVGLCFISFVQTTFIIEAMANANYLFKKVKHLSGRLNDQSSELIAPLIGNEEHGTDDDNYNDNLEAISRVSSQNSGHINEGFQISEDSLKSDNKQKLDDSEINDESVQFDIKKKFEIGSMTQTFFSKHFSRAFFISIIIYLYGDLVIYNTMMAKSLREMICQQKNCSEQNPENLPCWSSSSITRHNAYQLCTVMFVLILTPLIYAGIKKNQGVQIITIILRWVAFSSMIGITIRIFALDKAEGHAPKMDFVNMPKLFGICVYAFMCHHSLPSMVTPIRDKRKLLFYIAGEYLLLIIIYILVALTGIFAFSDINDVYTLNFQHNVCSDSSNNDNPAVIPGLDYFLPTFPIFTLFSSYTVIALTLINNMHVLLEGVINIENRSIRNSFPLIAIIPPLAISLFTEDVSSIVSYVGSYSGGLIQYVFPCLLVYYSRKHIINNFIQPLLVDRNISDKSAEEYYKEYNLFASPFQSVYWVIFTLAWWVISICLVTMDHVIEFVDKGKDK